VLLTIEADRTLWHSPLDKYHRTLKGEQNLEILLYLTMYVDIRCMYQLHRIEKSIFKRLKSMTESKLDYNGDLDF